MDCIDCCTQFFKTEFFTSQYSIGYLLAIMALLCVSLWTLALITYILSKLFSGTTHLVTEIESEARKTSADKSKNNFNIIIDTEEVMRVGHYFVISVASLSLVLVASIIGLVLIVKI